jgi:hypothetical protein
MWSDCAEIVTDRKMLEMSALEKPAKNMMIAQRVSVSSV